MSFLRWCASRLRRALTERAFARLVDAIAYKPPLFQPLIVSFAHLASLLHKSARMKTAWQGFPDHESAKIGSADLARHLAGEITLRLERRLPRGGHPGRRERQARGEAGERQNGEQVTVVEV